MGKWDHLINFDIKEMKKTQAQERAETAFKSQLSNTNKKRNRTKKKRSYSGKGYSYIEVDGKQVAEHRHKWEIHHGRKLLEHEAVYFNDGNRENLDVENLVLGYKAGKLPKVVICPHCDKDIFSQESDPELRS